MKTLGEWMDLFPEPYRSQAIENFNNPKCKVRCEDPISKRVSSAYDAAEYMFDWEKTPQGKVYWHDFKKSRSREENPIELIPVEPYYEIY